MYTPQWLQKLNKFHHIRLKAGRQVRLFAALSLLVFNACAILPNKNSERYYPGPAIRPQEYVPQNLVEEVVQPCSVTGPANRRMIVYLPKDYYSSGKRYPVIYLLHGARGYETSWIRFGRVYETTDSLWREGKAPECIVVMPNLNQYNDESDYDGGRFKGAYESIWEVDGKAEWAFCKDVVDLTDSLYRTIPDKQHRAVAGLSIGGLQSIYFGANHPDIFGYIGAFSPYFWTAGKNHAYRKAFYGDLHGKMAREFRDSPPSGYYLYAGKWDLARPATLHHHQYMIRMGYPHHYAKYPGSHDWPNGGWADEYCDFLQKIFQEDES